MSEMLKNYNKKTKQKNAIISDKLFTSSGSKYNHLIFVFEIIAKKCIILTKI